MRFFSVWKISLLFLAGMMLAGCNVPVVSRFGQLPNQVGIYYRSEVEGKDLMVQVRGTPFGGSEEDFARTVTAMISPPTWYRPPARVVTVSPYEKNPSFRLVFLFGAPYVAGGVRACQETATLELAPSAAPLSVQGAVCMDDKMIAEADGRIARVSGPDDPALRQLITSMTSEMLAYQGFEQPSSSTDWLYRQPK